MIKLGPASILNQNPIFEMGSKYFLDKTLDVVKRI